MINISENSYFIKKDLALDFMKEMIELYPEREVCLGKENNNSYYVYTRWG
jgi:hypothetical protein